MPLRHACSNDDTRSVQVVYHCEMLTFDRPLHCVNFDTFQRCCVQKSNFPASRDGEILIVVALLDIHDLEVRSSECKAVNARKRVAAGSSEREKAGESKR